MNIDASRAPLGALTQALSRTARPTAAVTYDSAGTPLTAGDVKVLRAISGRDDFCWPPNPNEPNQSIPAVLGLGGYRADQIARGQRITELTEQDVNQLVTKGIFSREEGARARDYLRDQLSGDTQSRQGTSGTAASLSSSPAVEADYSQGLGDGARFYL